MNKTIGIKLADGSFYPILEEEHAGKKNLDLTTVRDNQTTVQVDLYRSETRSMKDAEYVDTLQIDNLAAHPNGEPDISLDILLDENGKLSAEIKDEESGRHSGVSVNLVNRSEEERKAPANFELSAGGDPEQTDSGERHSGPGNGLLAAAEKKAASSAAEKAQPAPSAEPFSFDAVDIPNDFDQETGPETVEKTPDQNREPAIGFEESPAELDEHDLQMEEPDTPEKPVVDISETPAEFTEKEPAEKDSTAEEKDDHFFDLPDFDSIGAEPSSASPEPLQPAQEDAAELNETEFDMPDFDDTVPDEKAAGNADTADSSGLNFSGLYDKETADGTAADYTAEAEKKTKKHVIICAVCAVICIIATVLVLFVVPSRLNLIKPKTGTAKAVQSAAPIAVLPPEPQPAPAAPVPEPPAPPAEENKVVVPATPEVLPAAPQPQTGKNADITYKIHWGDTLWDLSETYYKNPWNYHRIAKYNHIRNPDYIISGTTIIIPAP